MPSVVPLFSLNIKWISMHEAGDTHSTRLKCISWAKFPLHDGMQGKEKAQNSANESHLLSKGWKSMYVW